MAVRYRYVFKTGIMEDKTIPAKLIYRKIKGKLSAVEEERFDAWLKEGMGTSGILRADAENISGREYAGSCGRKIQGCMGDV